MRNTETSASQPTATQRLALIAALAGIGLLCWALREVLLLAFAATLIAVALHGIADPIARRTPLSRAVALSLAGLFVLAVLAGIVWLFGAQIGAQVDSMVRQLPEAWGRLRETLSGSEWGASLIAEAESWLSAGNGGLIGSALNRAGGYTLSAAGGLLDGIVVVFAAIFLAVAPSVYLEGGLKLLPRSRRDGIREAAIASSRGLKKWLLGTLVSMLAIVVMVGVALAFLGVPAFFALALVAGIAQFVPVVGPLLATLPGVLLALTVGLDTALWTGVVYLVASQIEANLLYPLIQNRAVSIPPALTLFAILAMGVLFGPLGIVLATPLLVVVMVFIVQLYVRGMLGEDVPVPGA